MRVFVTVGTQRFPFDRLLQAIDLSVLPREHDVFAQTGNSSYEPQNYPFDRFLGKEEFTRELSCADLVICHGGVGSIVGALNAGARVLAVPRNAAFGEHVDNHQAEIVGAFANRGYITACSDITHISEEAALAFTTDFVPYVTERCTIEEEIETFIRSVREGAR